MRFTVCDIKCNNYNSHTLRNGVLNTINAYYDGFEYTLYRKLEETTFNLYYVNVPKELLTNDMSLYTVSSFSLSSLHDNSKALAYLNAALL